MLRHIPLGTMMNLRDLGGYPAACGQETRWERLLRGDQPNGLTEQDFRWLLDRDMTTIIDLRKDRELERATDPLSAAGGFAYFHRPLTGGESPPARGESEEEGIIRGYFEMLDGKTDVTGILRVIANAPGGVLFHCTAGKDRTGCIAALLLLLCGVDMADVVADYQVSETYIVPLIRRVRAELPNAPAYLGYSKSAYLEGCLRLLNEKYGSVSDYLLAAGLTETEQALLRRKLLE